MSENGVNRAVYKFDEFEVDPVSRSLAADGEQIALTPKVFEMLVAFIERPGELLEKDELMSRLWPDSFVEEANLAQNVAVLRKALGENSRHPKYILTVPGRGYRFIGEVQSLSRESANGHAAQKQEETVQPAPPTSKKKTSTVEWAILAAGVLAIVAAGIWFYGGWRSGPPLTVERTAQLTTWSGLDFYPTISPDATTVAFSSDRTGSFEIYTRQVRQGAREVQVTNDGQQNFQPAFSPDGTQIAYTSKLRPGIYVIPSTGGAVLQLTTFGTRPSWSPDGRTIAFQSDPLNDLGANVRNAMPPSTLWTVPATGGNPVQITKPNAPEGGHGAPSWSPDGKLILFDVNDWAASELWTLSVADGSFRKVNKATQQESDAIFSPDGSKIFFIGDNGSSVRYVPVSAAGVATAEPVKLMDASGTRIRQISIDRSGKRIAYAALGTVSNVWMTGPDGNSAPLTRNANTRTVLPAFSPDGKRIVYQSFRTGSLAHIWIMNADGSDQRQLSSREGLNPAWSGDGSAVYFAGPAETPPGFWSIDPNTGLERKLFDFDEPETFGARPSPDGRYIVFNSNRSGVPNLWRRDISGSSEPRQFTFDPEYAGFPAYSPDGKWVAVQIKRGENTHVGVMPAEGGEILQLSNEPGQSWVNSWAGDNDRIIFAGQRNGIWNIFSISRTTRAIEQITNFTKLNQYVRYPGFSPTEEKVAYEHAETNGNIWMMNLK